MKVYVVTSGRYSGYEIAAVFLNREVADRYVTTQHAKPKAFYRDDSKGRGYRVEEYETIGPDEEAKA